jgi:hypothetical protein
MHPQTDASLHDNRHGTMPLRAEPAATYDIDPPTESSPLPEHQTSVWAFTARVVTGLVMAALAAGLVIVFIQLHQAQGKLTKVSSQYAQLSNALGVNASKTGGTLGNLSGSVGTLSGTVASLKHEMAVLRGKVDNPAAPHYGVCLVRTTDNATGDLANITLVTPVVTGASYSCPQGNLVSVVPAP